MALLGCDMAAAIGDDVIPDPDRSAIGALETADQTQQGRLPAARRAQDGDQAAGATFRSTARNPSTVFGPKLLLNQMIMKFGHDEARTLERPNNVANTQEEAKRDG